MTIRGKLASAKRLCVEHIQNFWEVLPYAATFRKYETKKKVQVKAYSAVPASEMCLRNRKVQIASIVYRAMGRMCSFQMHITFPLARDVQ